jgi:DNA polymerase-3 subunit gamma/tau
MYQTLYRKYRPQNFDEVVGQKVIVKTLKNAIINQRLNHAYLFTGPRGTGKTSIAKIFAKTINCMNLNNANPCNECDSCLEIINKQSVDIIEIDAASNNGVDEIRELRNKANLVPTIGKYKVYIIDEVHMLTTGAFNALLKTLEEPPSHIIFILATTEPHKIPTTILSRCQRFDFKKISKDDMIEKLKKISIEEEIEVEEKAYEEIARLSDGCMRDALSIFDQTIAYAGNKITLENVHEINGTLPETEIVDFIKNIKLDNYEDIFSKIEQYDNLGINYIKLTEEMMNVLKNIMLYINIPNYFHDKQKKEIYDNVTEIISNLDILKYIKKINEYLFEMKKTNNVRIIFEMLIISMMEDKIVNEKNNTLSLQNTNNSDFIKLKENKKVENDQSIEQKDNKKEINMQNNINIEKIEKKVFLENNDKLKQFKDIRVNNTLSSFNKQKMIEIKNKIGEFKNLLINSEYSDYASIILDSEIKAASDDHIIFLCKNKRMEEEFLKNLLQIDMTLEKVYKKKMFSIATNEEEWNIIKNEFNNKLKKYNWIEEPSDLKEYFKSEKKYTSDIDNIFGDIVEYS